MNVIRNIEIDEEQAKWLDCEIANGNIANEDEFINDLLLEAKMRASQGLEEIRKIRLLLDEADEAGNSSRSPDDVWKELFATNK